MKKPVTLLSIAMLLSACSLLDEGSDQPNDPANNSAPTVQLTATPQSGPAPLTVNLSATATDPEGDGLSYSWSLQGLGSAATATTVLSEAGSYPITVTVSDGTNETQASTTVTVTDESTVDPEPPTNPEPPTTEPQITIKASPGGPAPWAVRYDYTATGYPEGSVVSISCNSDGSPFWDSNIVRTIIDSNTTACLHLESNEKVTVTVQANSDPASEVLDTKTIDADVQPMGVVPFAGTWRFTLGDSAPVTFSITEPIEGIGGKDATGTYNVGYASEDDAGYIFLSIADFYYGDTTEKVEVEPLEDGSQRFVSSDNWDGESFILEKID